jgi:hypothetical protein
VIGCLCAANKPQAILEDVVQLLGKGAVDSSAATISMSALLHGRNSGSH